ncbi:MAG: hypothetical protein GEV03_25295 [Streptosporangiales bacterium]|nr:hypothetical protein [Streptosporangiales bacterium]
MADLVYDSLLDAEESQDGAPRRLTFARERIRVDLEVTETPDQARIAVQLTPPGEASIEVWAPSACFDLTAGADGRVEFRLPARTLASMIISTPSTGRRLQTAWVRL